MKISNVRENENSSRKCEFKGFLVHFPEGLAPLEEFYYIA